MTDTPTPRASVLVVGGGYGGINAAKALDDIANVTLVDPTDAFVHNIAAWRALVDPAWLERIFFPYAHLLAHGRFLRDRAVAIDGRRVTLESGDVLEPDYLVLATGSAYPFPAKTEEPDIASAIARHRAAHEALLAADRALIVGAGPSGARAPGRSRPPRRRRRRRRHDRRPQGPPHGHRPLRGALRHRPALGRLTQPDPLNRDECRRRDARRRLPDRRPGATRPRRHSPLDRRARANGRRRARSPRGEMLNPSPLPPPARPESPPRGAITAEYRCGSRAGLSP
jgi:Pyridine nucleotide-disulphide oxidoreductase